MADESKPPRKRTGRKAGPKAGPRRSTEDERIEKAVQDLITGQPAEYGDPVEDEMKDHDNVRVFKPRKRVRIGERWTVVLNMLQAEGITMDEFVKTLSPEELVRGQLKNDKGSFVGAPSRWVPREFHKACIAELMKRGKKMYQGAYLDAIQVFVDIATNRNTEPQHRLKAAQYVIERLEGKVPEKLDIGITEAPWQGLLGGIVAEVDEEQLKNAQRILSGEEAG